MIFRRTGSILILFFIRVQLRLFEQLLTFKEYLNKFTSIVIFLEQKENNRSQNHSIFGKRQEILLY